MWILQFWNFNRCSNAFDCDFDISYFKLYEFLKRFKSFRILRISFKSLDSKFKSLICNLTTNSSATIIVNGQVQCNNCKKTPVNDYVYMFQLKVEDETGSVNVIVFHEDAVQIEFFEKFDNSIFRKSCCWDFRP